MTIGFIPSAAVGALQEPTTHMGFVGGDGWVMSQDYVMAVLSLLSS
jgi:hypothetical protein